MDNFFYRPLFCIFNAKSEEIAGSRSETNEKASCPHVVPWQRQHWSAVGISEDHVDEIRYA